MIWDYPENKEVVLQKPKEDKQKTKAQESVFAII